VAEGFDVAVPVVVVVDADVVLGEAQGPGPDVAVGQHRHVFNASLLSEKGTILTPIIQH
jgi:hypothetical protein